VSIDNDDEPVGIFAGIAARLPPGILRRPGSALAEEAAAADQPEERYFARSADSVVQFAPRNRAGRLFPSQRDRGQNTRARGLDLLTPAECAASPPRGYIIKGLVAPRDLVIVFGQPGSGKSVITPHLAYAIARGVDVFGRRVRQGRVLYVAVEDPHGMRQRVHALMVEQGDAPDFFLVDGVSDLMSADSPDRADLRNLVADTEPALVIIDTIAAGFPGLRENEAEDMGNVVRFARSLTDTGAAVILVHHAPKAEGSTPRGHGSLNGDADAALLLTRIGTEVAGSLTKNRNGSSDVTISFAITATQIGTDEDGDAITAPTLTEQAAKAPGKRLLTPAEEAARRYLADVLATEGKPLPAGADYPKGMRGVSEEAWRAECETRRLSTAETEENRYRIFRRVYQQLLGKKQVAARDGLVWLTSPESENL
jgi:hypothetical protein